MGRRRNVTCTAKKAKLKIGNLMALLDRKQYHPSTYGISHIEYWTKYGYSALTMDYAWVCCRCR